MKTMIKTSIAVASLAFAATLPAQQQATTLVLRNNHELAFRGPIDLTTPLADGHYAGPNAVADVRGGKAHVVATLAPKSEITLVRRGAPSDKPFADGPLSVAPSATSLELRWDKQRVLGDSFDQSRARSSCLPVPRPARRRRRPQLHTTRRSHGPPRLMAR